MYSTRKITPFVARIVFGVIVLTGALVLLSRASDSARSSVIQVHSRIVTRKPWPVEPVRVIAAKNKKRVLEIDKPFDEDDDWLEGFAVTVVNNSDKTVTSISIDMIFRREPGDTQPPVVEELHFGPRPMLPEYNLRDRRKVIRVGETVALQLNSHNYGMMTDRLQRKGYSNSIVRVELVIRAVGFEDGSVLYSDTLFVQDPEHPDDPTRKIRADKLKPPGTLNHHTVAPARPRLYPKKKVRF